LILYEERLSPSANATIQVRVEEEVDPKLTKYAECTDATPAFVVAEWLVMLFKLTNLLLTELIIRRSPKSRNQVKSGNESPWNGVLSPGVDLAKGKSCGQEYTR